MSHILRLVGRSAPAFRPRSVDEFFALQLAQRLGDEANVHRYVHLVERLPQNLLLRVYKRVLEHRQGQESLARLFNQELETNPGWGES